MNLKRADYKSTQDCPSRVCNVAPLWRSGVLTGAAQALLPQAQQHALAHVAVNGLVEVFHPPEVLTVSLGHLLVKGGMIGAGGERERSSPNGLKRMDKATQTCTFHGCFVAATPDHAPDPGFKSNQHGP